MNYGDYGKMHTADVSDMLRRRGCSEMPTAYGEFLKLDQRLRKEIGKHLPLVLSDNYEHFMACLPGKKFAAQHVLIRRQIGGFTVAAGYWKWLEFLSHQITRNEVELAADFYSGKHNGFPRQFNKDYWLHVVDDYNGYLPIRVDFPGEGTVFTGVPFPVAEIYGEKPAVWVNEPIYIQIGQLSHVATIAAQFAEILGDPWRFIEVAFRALPNVEFSDDMLLAMLIGGGIISTSNDLGAFINGAPFKCAGTTGHCYYQQFKYFKDSLRALLGSPLGPYSTVLLDVNQHDHGFKQLQEVLAEGYPPPFADRPDSGDTLKQGMRDLTVLQDNDMNINVVFEDSKNPEDVQEAELTRRQYGLEEKRATYGAGGTFMGKRSLLECAYKSCYFHDGTVENPIDELDTMKICLDDKMKKSFPGRVEWFFDPKEGFFKLGCRGEAILEGYVNRRQTLYDNLSDPGNPHFNPGYDLLNLATSSAIVDGIERSKATRKLLGSKITLKLEPNKIGIGMTKDARRKRDALYEIALETIKQ